MMISIVVPMHNEAENVGRMVQEIADATQEFAKREAILVDDGSTDDTAKLIQDLQKQHDWLRLLQHPKAGGQSSAVHSGVLAAKGDVICTMDGDLQNPPAEIPNMVAPFFQEGAEDLGLVAGQRVNRQDTKAKLWASRAANALRVRMLKDETRDTGCGLKAFRRDGFLALPYFNHMHRYLPALFGRDGWRVAHVDVSHRERTGGASKYTNFGRAMVGVYDLIGVAWLIKRRKTARAFEPARPETTPQTGAE